jgi:hypothetical protein
MRLTPIDTASHRAESPRSGPWFLLPAALVANFSGRAANHRQAHIHIRNASKGFQDEPEAFVLEIAQRAETKLN